MTRRFSDQGLQAIFDVSFWILITNIDFEDIKKCSTFLLYSSTVKSMWNEHKCCQYTNTKSEKNVQWHCFCETKSAVSISNYTNRDSHRIVQHCIVLKQPTKILKIKAKVVFLYTDRMWGDKNNNTFVFIQKTEANIMWPNFINMAFPPGDTWIRKQK